MFCLDSQKKTYQKLRWEKCLQTKIFWITRELLTTTTYYLMRTFLSMLLHLAFDNGFLTQQIFLNNFKCSQPYKPQLFLKLSNLLNHVAKNGKWPNPIIIFWRQWLIILCVIGAKQCDARVSLQCSERLTLGHNRVKCLIIMLLDSFHATQLSIIYYKIAVYTRPPPPSMPTSLCIISISGQCVQFMLECHTTKLWQSSLTAALHTDHHKYSWQINLL